MNRIVLFVFVNLVLCNALGQGGAADSNVSEADKIQFQVTPNSIRYKPEEMMRIMFVITNHGTTPLYIGRGIGTCSKWTGHSELQIVDEKGENTIEVGCSVQIGPISDSNLVLFMDDTKRWLRLDPGEIYGTEELFKLPTKAGRYRLKGELWPPGLPERQRAILAQRQIRVLKSRHRARVVTFTIDGAK